MATQICPNCKQDAFTWSIDKDESALTKWDCYKCGYTAWEDESLERTCPTCHQKTEMHLQDHIKRFWWCTSCNK